MRAFSSCALSLLFLGAACVAPVPQAPSSFQMSSEIAKACKDLGRIDLARIPREVPDWSRFDAFHSEARRGIAPMAMGKGGTVLRVAIPGGSVQAPYGLSVWAIRGSAGIWQVSHVRRLQLRPPPQPPGTAPLPEPPPAIIAAGRLKPHAAQVIEAALASDCLDREPFLSPATLPMKNGSDRICPPDAGGANALEIVDGGKTRRYLRECGRTWASGAIIIALEDSNNLVQPEASASP